MSLSHVAAQIKEVYQLELSEEQISKITDSVIEEVAKWHIRPLGSTYSIIHLDKIYINVLDNKTVIKKVVYAALGVNAKGHKELLWLWMSESEGSKFWLNVLTDLHNRGLRQVYVFCVDGLAGFPDAINSVYPKSMVPAVHRSRCAPQPRLREL